MTNVIIISVVVVLSVIILTVYVKDKIVTNRKYKPIEIEEAELLALQLRKKRYGQGRDSMKVFYNEFIQEFPMFDSYSYKYILQCLNPNNRERKNPDLVESVLIFLGNPLIVEGSVRHDSFLNK